MTRKYYTGIWCVCGRVTYINDRHLPQRGPIKACQEMLDARPFTTSHTFHVARKLSRQLFILFDIVEKRLVSILPDIVRSLSLRVRFTVFLRRLDGLRGHDGGSRRHKEGPVVQGGGFNESGRGAGMG